jgi:glyoxylase-like metal-dependent hydrolase (beta-lactamase superfamily II)
MMIMSDIIRPKVQGLEPQILLEGEFDLKDYGIEGKIIPTPGHTPGSVSVLLAGAVRWWGYDIRRAAEKKQPRIPLYLPGHGSGYQKHTGYAGQAAQNILCRARRAFTGGQVCASFSLSPDFSISAGPECSPERGALQPVY